MTKRNRLIIGTVITLTVFGAGDLLTVVTFSLTRLSITRADAVIVLGAKVGTPALTARTLKGLAYYQEGKVDTIVLSGGKGPGEPVSEAVAMRQVIESAVKEKGEKMPKIILEAKSTNTFQNIHNSKALIPNAQHVIVVTDCFHIARSVIIAKRDGFKEVSWDAPTPTYYSPGDLSYYYFRESVGMISYIPRFITN